MHIPDGFISPSVAIVTTITSTGFVALSLARIRDEINLKQAPVMALTTAFIFAAQMINFPVAGGTSGHLLGATLAVIILGNPWAATISIATVLLIQAVLFADGGITALGANIFNMAIVGVWVSWGLFKTLQRLLGGKKTRLPLVAGITACISTIAASFCCSLILIFSNTASASVVLPAMTGIHILIGVGEGLITGGVITYLITVRPDLLPGDEPPLQKWLIPVISTLLVAGVLSLFASSFPDGLEKVAENLGFIHLAENVRIPVNTPFADYQVAGINEQIGTSISGILGTIICFGLAFIMTKFIIRKSA
ncbi:energy-coupling factor ABC transporter permease [Geminocystis sp. GBBB08]|uniref:energy-coupling factor ABC transporter permease n=1 Tax=Geminocystis sp. GBBB08 TaxID=2604140 RepID=UPI0027E32EF0|nr:energy-coupling factor ABC transporter permease [Geminocystis sp. GBBB08]MBL1209048.1 cobalt transporter [Geminocystis sp. GBBB08]